MKKFAVENLKGVEYDLVKDLPDRLSQKDDLHYSTCPETVTIFSACTPLQILGLLFPNCFISY
jgi:predicted methyltransferase